MIIGSYTLGCLSGTVRFPVTTILESDALCLYPQEKMHSLFRRARLTAMCYRHGDLQSEKGDTGRKYAARTVPGVGLPAHKPAVAERGFVLLRFVFLTRR